MKSHIEIAYLPDGTPIEMVKVEVGKFMMGSDENEKEQPIHEVEVYDFYLGKYLVTNAQFLPFLQEVGNQKEGAREWVNLDGKFVNVRCGIEYHEGIYRCVAGLDQHPMIYVNWFGAKAYCQWLSKKTGNQFQLPSEAKWEYAAKGYQGSEDYRYAGSNKLSEVGWYNKNSHRETKPVGLKMGNKLGLYDMSGNVYEWCADHWHDNYEGAPQDGSTWIERGNDRYRVVRGGSWDLIDNNCRASFRDGRYVNYRYDYIGFRLSRY